MWSTPTSIDTEQFDVPDAMADASGGIHVVGWSNPAVLLSYSTAGWSQTKIQYDTSSGASDLGGSAENPMIVWPATNGPEWVRWDGMAFAEPTEVGHLSTDNQGFAYHARAASLGLLHSADDSAVFVSLFNGEWHGQQQLAFAPNMGFARIPDGAIDALGRAVMIWEQRDGNDNFNDRQVWGALYDGLAWTTPALVGQPAVFAARSPHVAVNAEGKGFAIWGEAGVFIRSLDLATGWGPIETPIDGSVWHVEISNLAINDAGAACAVWSQTSNTDAFLAGSVYTNGRGWSTPERVHGDPGTTTPAEISIDQNGRCLVAWKRDGFQSISVMHYSPLTGWGEANILAEASEEGKSLSEPAVAFNGEMAFVVWVEKQAAPPDLVFAAHADLPD